MADVKKVVEIEIDVDSGDIKQVEKDVEGVGKSLKKAGKNVEGVGKDLKKAGKGTSGLASGFKKVGTAIKATGIGLLIAALAALVEVFKSNQGAVDVFETGLTALKIAANDLFKFLESNVGGVIDYFKSIFEDPKQALIDFAEAFKKNIQERFDSYLDTLGFLASAVKKVFSGDFAGAMDDVKAAGKESLDVLTGVNNSFDKATEFVSEAVTAISDYTSETLKSAKASVELGKAAEIAAIQQQGLIEEFDRAAELQRQIRDDETKSFEERIAANEKLGEILQDQIDAETALIDIQQRSIQDRLAKGLIPEFEAKKQLLEIENERAAILAKVTGFESEQLTNRNSLLREQRDLQDEINQQAIDRQKELDDISLQLMEEGIDKELMMSAQKYDALHEIAYGNRELEKQLEEAFQREMQAIQDKYSLETKQKQDKERHDERKAQLAQAAQALDTTKDGLEAISSLKKAFRKKDENMSEAGRKRAFQSDKAFNIASAAITTASAAIKAYSSQLIPGDPTSMIRGSIAAGIVTATGLAKIAVIANQQYNPQGGGGGAGSVSSSSGAGVAAPPQFNTVGGSEVNQLSQSIANQNQSPVQAYVVANDVTSAQSLERNRKQQATFP